MYNSVKISLLTRWVVRYSYFKVIVIKLREYNMKYVYDVCLGVALNRRVETETEIC